MKTFLLFLSIVSLSFAANNAAKDVKPVIPSAVAVVDDKTQTIVLSGVLLTLDRVLVSCHGIVTPTNKTSPKAPSFAELNWRVTAANTGSRRMQNYSRQVNDLIISEECFSWERHALHVDVAILFLARPFDLEKGLVEPIELATHLRANLPQLWTDLISAKATCYEIGFRSKLADLTYGRLEPRPEPFCSAIDTMELFSFEDYLKTQSLGCAEIMTATTVEPSDMGGGPLVCNNKLYGMSHGQLSLDESKSYTLVSQIGYLLPFIRREVNPMMNLECGAWGGDTRDSKKLITISSNSNQVTASSFALVIAIISWSIE